MGSSPSRGGRGQQLTVVLERGVGDQLNYAPYEQGTYDGAAGSTKSRSAR